MLQKLIIGLFLTLLTLTSLLIFGDFLTNFFFQDDFFNITLSQRQPLIESFNIFSKPILNFYFFRPLTTQFFWGLTFPIFGWNVIPYHLIVALFFATNILLVYYLSKLITEKISVALLATFLYAFSATHFYRLFFLSQFQEIGLATFVLLTLIFYIKKSRWAIVFSLLALASKETAVVTPLVLLVYELLMRRKVAKLLLAHFLVLAGYLVSRILFFGFATGGPYTYDFHPLRFLNNLFWYLLWALGIPESFVNLKLFWVTKYNDLGHPTFSLVNPEIFTAFGIWGGPIVLVFAALLLTLFLAISNNNLRSLIAKSTLLTAGIFLIFLLPVAFFPFHKFAYSLTIPAVGFSIFLAILVVNFPLRFQISAILLFVVLSLFATQYNLSEHWAVKKAAVAKSAINYFRQNHPDKIVASNIYFRNTDVLACSTLKNKFKPSQEVAYGLGGVDSLRLLYHDPDLKVYFEDLDDNHNLRSDSLMIDSRLFVL